MSILEDLLWKKYFVGSDGFICLVDCMGNDASIVQAARVSYGKGTKRVQDDRNLIRYLYRHAHTTPFEMVEFKFLVRAPMDCWRQWIRHRTSNVNEYSTRYSEAIDSTALTDALEWRAQSTNNKQGSSDDKIDWPPDFEIPEEFLKLHPGIYLSSREADVQKYARDVYAERLKFGVAREQARKDLPLSTYTEAYWKCDLRNILNFLSLRMDAHAQLEIRTYANYMYEIVKQICPIAIEAFDDYDHRRGGLLLSRLDLIALQYFREYGLGLLVHPLEYRFNLACEQVGWNEKAREREEFRKKLISLGMFS